MKTTNTLAAIIAFTTIVTSAAAAPGDTASAVFLDIDGKGAGQASIIETDNGLLIAGRVGQAVSQGLHGIHIHAVGKCEAPFDSAGGHFNPQGREHGHHNAHGPHAGDLSNIDVGTSGDFEILAAGLTLDQSEAGLMDGDGASIIIHAGPDDDKTDPSGNSGARLLCGVIMRAD